MNNGEKCDTNWKVKFKNCKLELELESQTPMIHFQSEQSGATLRASEVKPKLDRFILGKLEQRKKKPDKSSNVYISEDREALDYKLSIIEPEKIDAIPLDSYKIFWGNMGKDKIKGIFSNPKVTIISFNKEVRGWIEEYIVEFFIVTNFGTMQGKGFGSFWPKICGCQNKLTEKDKKKIGEYLKDYTKSEVCYCTNIRTGQGKVKDCPKMFQWIKEFYSVMKAGKNHGKYIKSYVYQYMFDKGIGNEKAWMKKKGISPNIAEECQKKNNQHGGGVKKYRTIANEDCHKKCAMCGDNPKYVRGMLGVGTSSSYININENGYRVKDVVVTIESSDDNNLERVNSPIYFKIIKDTVFITCFPIDERLYDAEFSFISSMGSGTLRTPSKGEFPIEKILSFAEDEFNKDYKNGYNNMSLMEEIIRGGKSQ